MTTNLVDYSRNLFSRSLKSASLAKSRCRQACTASRGSRAFIPCVFQLLVAGGCWRFLARGRFTLVSPLLCSCIVSMGAPQVVLVVKLSPASAGARRERDARLTPGLGLQRSCQENSMDRRAWRPSAYRVAECEVT